MDGLAARLRQVVAATDAYRQTVGRVLGLGSSETTILIHLLHEGSRTPSALARRVGVTPASVTAQLDRLEQAGHVVRRMNPRDRRSLLIDLTHQGRSTAEAIWEVFSRDVADGAEGMDPVVADGVDRVLGQVVARLEARARNGPAMARALNRSG
ncbi:MAG: MarR family transcriptional regulator [Pseudonocardia sp.]|nr:MarR family transcriptional regulator [Pseudonocardia sp.]